MDFTMLLPQAIGVLKDIIFKGKESASNSVESASSQPLEWLLGLILSSKKQEKLQVQEPYLVHIGEWSAPVTLLTAKGVV